MRQGRLSLIQVNRLINACCKLILVFHLKLLDIVFEYDAQFLQQRLEKLQGLETIFAFQVKTIGPRKVFYAS